MDTLTKERRSALMKVVRQKDTAPEMLVRRELHKRGLRYKIGDRKLPGSPDLSFPRYRTVIFVHGCFWHGHDCRLGKLPSSNIEFWTQKMEANRRRDARKEQTLRDRGWRVIIVWQCELEMEAGLCRLFDSLAQCIRASGDAGCDPRPKRQTR